MSASRRAPELTALMITYAAYNVANIGLFTSLLSGGLSLLILAFYYMQTCKPLVPVSIRLYPASENVHRSKFRAAPGSVS